MIDEKFFPKKLDRICFRRLSLIWQALNDKSLLRTALDFTMVKFKKSPPSEIINDEQKSIAWIITVANHYIIDELRKIKKEKEILIQTKDCSGESAAGCYSDNSFGNTDQKIDYDSYIEYAEKVLSPDLLEIFRLELEGYSTNEIADARKVSVRTVYRKIDKIRNILSPPNIKFSDN